MNLLSASGDFRSTSLLCGDQRWGTGPRGGAGSGQQTDGRALGCFSLGNSWCLVWGGAEEEDTCSDLVSASALGRVCCEPALPRGFNWTVPVAIWRALARGDGTVTLAGSGLPGDIVGDE